MKKSPKNLFLSVCVFINIMLFVFTMLFVGKPFSSPTTVNAGQFSHYWGVDVSKHNGDLNFAKMKAAGVQFAIVRAGYGKNNIDPKFKRNMNGFLGQNIHVGAYWFLYSLNASDAVKEADYFDAALRNNGYWGKLKFPVFCDFEYDSENYMKKNGVTPTKALDTAIMKAFCDRMASHGWYVGNYANNDYCLNHFNFGGVHPAYDLWYARYRSNNPNGSDPKNRPVIKGVSAAMWQYSSDGVVNGSSARTDVNFCYLDYPSIIVNKGLNGFNKPAPPAPPADTLATDKTDYAFNDPIKVKAKSNKPDAWVGIFPEAETDGHKYLRWYYVKDKNDCYVDIRTATAGTHVSDTEVKPGNYKIVLFPDNGVDLNGKLCKKIKLKRQDLLMTDRTTYYPDEPIKVKARSDDPNAWVGIFPESETDGSKYITYFYVKGKNDFVDIKTATPGKNVSDTEFKAGKYKVVLFPDNGTDLNGKLHKVVTLKNKDLLLTDRTVYTLDDPIKVKAKSDNPDAWVGIFPESETDGSRYIRCFNIKGKNDFVDIKTATLGTNASDTEFKAGKYKVVLFPDAGTYLSGRLSKTITLQTVCDKIKPVLKLAGGVPASAKIGDKILIPNAVAHDDIDGDIEAKRYVRFNGADIAFVGNIFIPSEKGKLEIIWEAVDSSGNSADPIQKVIVITDKAQDGNVSTVVSRVSSKGGSGCGGSITAGLLPGIVALFGAGWMISRKRRS